MTAAREPTQQQAARRGGVKLNLNGIWDFHPNDADRGYPVMVPTWWDSLPETTGYPDSWSRDLHHGVYLKEFFLGALDPNEDMILHLDALATLGKVSINAIPVGPSSTKGYLMTLLPYDLDVTRAVHAGRNQIRIEIWSVKSLPADALTSAEGPDRLLFPFGTENLVGRLGLGGDVWLNSRPKIRIEDLQIISDLGGDADPSNDRLELNATLINTSERPCDLRFRAKVRPGKPSMRRGRTVFAFNPVSCSLSPRSSKVVHLQTAWPDAHYWSRADPFLYVMQALLDVGGHVVDHSQERFGFRQFQRQGDRYLLNGIPIRLRGDSLCLLNQGSRDLINEVGDAYGLILDDNQSGQDMTKAWVDAYRHANFNILRNHIRSVPSQALADHADETGMLLEEETAFWNPGSPANVQLNPPFHMSYGPEAIGHYVEWTQRWVRAYRNHPSIVLWSTTNEAWNPRDGDLLIPALQAAVHEQDGTRPVVNDGFNAPITDEDSRHYYGGYPSGMTSAPDIYALYDIDSPLPLAAGEEFSVSTAGIPRYDGQGRIADIYHGRLNGDPDTISRADFGREVGRVTRGIRTTRVVDWKPFCISAFIYDNIEACLEPDRRRIRRGLNPKRLVRPQFDPWRGKDEPWQEGPAFGYIAASFADVAAYDKEFDREPRLGRPRRIYPYAMTSRRTIIVHNDEERRGTDLELVWQVAWQRGPGGRRIVAERGHRRVQVPYASWRTVPATITVPRDQASRGARLLLVLCVRKQGRQVFREENFLGWIEHAAPPRLGTARPRIDLGRVEWVSREVKHCIHLRQEGGAMSERWSAQVLEDAEGAFSLENMNGNLRHEQDIYYTVNPSGLEPGHRYRARVRFRGELQETTTVTVTFTAGRRPRRQARADLAAGARVQVSSQADLPGWTRAALVDGRLGAAYDRFGWSSSVGNRNHPEWVLLEMRQAATLSQVVLAPRGRDPSGGADQSSQRSGTDSFGVVEYAAGNRSTDPNQGQGFPLDFSISLSSDGRSWTRVCSRHNYPLPVDGRPQAFDFAPMSNIRFIRIEATRLRANPYQGGRYALQLSQIMAFSRHRLPAIPAAPKSIDALPHGHCLRLDWQHGPIRHQADAPRTAQVLLRDRKGRSMTFYLDRSQGRADLDGIPFGSWRMILQECNSTGIGEPADPLELHMGPPEAGRTDPTLPRPGNPQVSIDLATMTVHLTIDQAPQEFSGCELTLKPADEHDPMPTVWLPADRQTHSFRQVPPGIYRVMAALTTEDGRVSLPSFQDDPLILGHTPGRPGKPRLTSSDKTMQASWSPPNDGGIPLQAYLVTVHEMGRGQSARLRLAAKQTTLALNDLEPGKYTVSVSAINAAGAGPESPASLPCLISEGGHER